jgi:zinc transport system substrate-binding protein
MFRFGRRGKGSHAAASATMIDLAKKENIKVIFYQEEIDSSQSEAFAEELGGKTVQLAPLAADYIENLRRMVETMAEGMK